ncbi:hypothetical protein Aduo_013801 [Ancylostoma duodenale]
MARIRITHGIAFGFALTCFVGLTTIVSNSRNHSRRAGKDDVVKYSNLEVDVMTTPSAERGEDHLSSKAWNSFPGIYVHLAYKISNKEIRFVYLEDAQNRRAINALVNGKWSRVKSTCFNETSCEDYLYCTIATRFGAVDISSARHSIKAISLAAEGSEEFFNVNVK